MDSIDELLKYNEYFVENKLYEKYATTKIPNKKLAIVTCMDTRLTKILYKCLNIKNGDAKIIKNAGGMVTSECDDVMRSLVVATNFLQVDNIMIISHDDCGMCNLESSELSNTFSHLEISEFEEKNNFKLDEWLHSFAREDTAVKNSMNIVKNHPLIRNDVCVRGFVINPSTGKLREVK